jgi:hypothetical protein
MSSQGPKVTGTPDYNGFRPDPSSGTPSSALGYTFTKASIRDGSDWIAYKKQQLIKQETTEHINQTTWFKAGNDFRIQYLLGKYKCDGCKIEGSVQSS